MHLPNPLQLDLDSVRRILLIKPSAIGDVVHTLPILGQLRARFPSAHIAWLVAPQCAGLLEGHPQLDEVVVFDRKLFGTAWRSPSAAVGLGRFMLSLRGRFDLVLDLQGLLRSGLLSRATNARIRLGLGSAREGAIFFYTHTVDDGARRAGAELPVASEGPGGRHALERYLDMTEALGLGRGPVEFRFNTTEGDRGRVRELLGALAGRRFAVLLPGTNWATKRWPAERFGALAAHLREELGLATVVCGGKSDGAFAEVIGPTLDLTGRTSLAETTALLELASLVVANDTGPMHIAAALGRPLVALFGPTSEVLTGPYGRPGSTLRLELPCAPCFSRSCSHTSCLRNLSETSVLEAAKAELRE